MDNLLPPALKDHIEESLELEFVPRFSWKKALSIMFATLLLVAGISCIIESTIEYKFFGSICFLIFVRIVMGSPIEMTVIEKSSTSDDIDDDNV